MRMTVPRACGLAAAAAAVFALFALGAPTGAQAHAMLHEVLEGETVILRFSFPGPDEPLFEPYEVFAPGDDTPFQAGRVNAIGEVSFRPDRPGVWRVRVFTADGHGAEVELAVDADGAVVTTSGRHGHAYDHWLRVLAALGYLLGAFGLLALWRVRRARPHAG
jgi:nickel transport protein